MSGRLKWTFIFRRIILWFFCQSTGWFWKKFEQSLKNPQQQQKKVLLDILSRVNPPLSIKAFETYPLCQYEDLSLQIEQAKVSGQNFLTRQPPLFYEPTSGSSGDRKLIPYTAALLQSFTHLFVLWTYDLLRYRLNLCGGRLYFSISPQFQNTGEGLSDDSAYLTGLTGWFFRFFVLVPPQIKKLHDPEQFYYILALYLLAAEDLEVISIWSPGFLIAVLDYIQTQRFELAEAGQKKVHKIKNLTFYTGQIPNSVSQALKSEKVEWTQIFPNLRLISCWGAQNSAIGFQALKNMFPKVYIQEKGLLATEAPITFPSECYGTFLPVLDQVYFEFLCEDGRLLTLAELVEGQCYELVITQKSGLIRYRIGDYVKVQGKVHQTPCFHFVGRAHTISDLVGEKLNETWLVNLITEGWPGIYLCLIPDLKSSGYRLFSSAAIDVQSFEAKLMSSPHYCNARLLNQLSPLKAWVVPDLAQQIKHFFCVQRKMKWGDIKEQWLYSRETDGVLSEFLINVSTMSRDK